MRNIKKIFIVVFSLILLFAVSCSNDDKTGVKNNPTENDTEITDGETGSGGTGSGSGGSSETGTGGSGSGSGSGSGEGGGTRTLSYYAGDWYGMLPGEETEEEKLITINADGSVTAAPGAGSGELPSTSIIKNSDTSYTCQSGSLTIYFNFSNDTKGKMKIVSSEGGSPAVITITKK